MVIVKILIILCEIKMAGKTQMSHLLRHCMHLNE